MGTWRVARCTARGLSGLRVSETAGRKRDQETPPRTSLGYHIRRRWYGKYPSRGQGEGRLATGSAALITRPRRRMASSRRGGVLLAKLRRRQCLACPPCLLANTSPGEKA